MSSVLYTCEMFKLDAVTSFCGIEYQKILVIRISFWSRA